MNVFPYIRVFSIEKDTHGLASLLGFVVLAICLGFLIGTRFNPLTVYQEIAERENGP